MTTLQNVAAALTRVQAVLQRRPEAGLHDDAPAAARWQSGLRFVAGHANGAQIATDLPAELGGSSDQVTPGWLFRSGPDDVQLVVKISAPGVSPERLAA